MWQRKNLVLRAPTGSGKTIAVLAPFLYSREAIGVARMIYALPLRSLAQGIYREARQLCCRLGNAFHVTLQTFGACENVPSSARLKWPALGTGLGTETRVIAVSSTPKACGGISYHPRRRRVGPAGLR